MGFFKRMTKKKIEVLTRLRDGFEVECGLAPYSAESVSKIINGCTTNSLTRAMRKTLNTLVDEKLLFKVKLIAGVTVCYEEGVSHIKKNVWHYDLIERECSAEDINAKRQAIEADKQADIDSR